MAKATPMALMRIKMGMTQAQCAAKLTALSGKEITQTRWSRLELGTVVDLAKADYMTVFYISRVLKCQTWELVPRAARRVALDERNARRRAERKAAKP